jgi:class 3 adenylate cyclase/CHASE2 domain-containing sensor protein
VQAFGRKDNQRVGQFPTGPWFIVRSDAGARRAVLSVTLVKSDRRRPQWFAALLGLLIGGALAIPLLVPIDSVSGLQLLAADEVFASEKGPQLGFFPHRLDIVIVTADVPTVTQMGNPTPATDVALYRALLEQGASVVGDPRPIANPNDATTIVRGLEQVPGAAGHVFRNIELPPSNPPTLTDAEKMNYVAADLTYTDAASDVNHTVRYYPLISWDADHHFDETLVLKMARVALGTPLTTNTLLAARNAGIAGVWFRLTISPSQITGALRAAVNVPPAPYPLGAGHQIPWVVHPSVQESALVLPAAIWIKYRSAPGTAADLPVYPHYSYVNALQGSLPPGALKGKVVLIDDIGSTYPVPTATRNETLAELDGQVLEEVLDGTYLQPESKLIAVPAVLLLALIGSLAFTLAGLARALGVMGAALVVYLGVSTILYRSGTFPDLVLAPAALLTASATSGGRRYVQETLERRRIYDLFGRYVPRTVVAELVRRPADRALALGGDKRELTVLFADVRGFTSFSEHLPPEEVLGQLNKVLRSLVEAAFEEQGTVDKYIGDAVMVLFNAPLEQTDHGERAVRTALKMQAALTDSQLSVGVGIHSGIAVVGNVGTAERLEYTAIGSTVNMAARLCESAGKGEIIISEDFRARFGDRIEAEVRASILVKGIDRELVTYKVTGLRAP